MVAAHLKGEDLQLVDRLSFQELLGDTQRSGVGAESYYEIEVILDNGRQVDVQLDESFAVVGTEDEGFGLDE